MLFTVVPFASVRFHSVVQKLRVCCGGTIAMVEIFQQLIANMTRNFETTRKCNPQIIIRYHPDGLPI